MSAATINESERLKQNNALLTAISRAQEHLIANAGLRQLFDSLLADFIELTQSEYGFIGDVLYQADGQPYLKTHAVTDITWDAQSRSFYQAKASKGLEFTNLKTLFGAVIPSGEAVIANDPGSDPRSGGLPEGHPKLDAFLGVPVYFGGKLMGMIGVANRAGGYEQWIVDYLQPLLKTYGQIIEITRGDTQRRQSEHELRESEQRFRQLAENIEEVFWITSADGHALVYVSPSYETIWGRSRESLYQNPMEWLAAIHAEDVAHVGEVYETVASGGFDVQYRIIRPGKSQRWIHDRGFPVRNKAGEVYRIAGIAQDITQQKITEQALIEARDDLERRVTQRTQSLSELNHLLEATFASLSDAVFVVDTKSLKIISANQAASKIFGYRNAEILGQNIERLHVSHDHYERFRHRMSSSVDATGVFNSEYQLKRKNGDVFATENTVTEIKDEAGQRTALVSVVRDIAERKQAEQTIKAHIDHLNAIERISHLALKSDIDDMMGSVLEEMLDIFDCDRAWFLFSCDHHAPNWTVTMERTRPEWPGVSEHGVELPMTSDTAELFKVALEEEGVVRYDAESGRDVPDTAKQFGVQAQMVMALPVKVGQPCFLALSHCAHAHVFTPQQESLFGDIGHRLIDALRGLFAVADLQKSESSLAEVQRIARLGSWELDLVNNKLNWSDEVFRIFNLDPAQFGATYEAFLELVYADDRASVDKAYRDSVANHIPYDITHRLLLHDGSLKYVNEKGETQCDGNGRALQSIGTVQDITERVLAEQALRDQNDWNEAILHTTMEGFILADRDGVLIDVNPAYCDVIGYSRDELLRMNIRDLEAQLSVEQATEVIDHMLNVGRERFETRHRRKDGELVDLEVSFVVMRHEKIPLIAAFVRDITARKKAEEELLKLAAIVKHTDEGVLVTDADDNIVFVNQAFTGITGYLGEDVLGQSPRVLKSERHDEKFYRAMWSAIEQEGLWQGEVWDRRKNGEIFPVWQTTSEVRDDNGELTNYVSIFSDITTIKRSQEKLDFLAHHDPLTSLPNRLLFHDRLGHALQRAKRESTQLAVLFFDLDRFKNINDSLGHAVGDALLQDVADRMSHMVRKKDTMARLGGDEFVVLIEDVGEAQYVAQFARKIITAFADPFVINEHELHITVSIGISLFPRDAEDGDALLSNADAAMYRAKQTGRNDYQFYTAALTASVFEHLTLEAALRNALSREEFVLYYQPQYCLKTRELTGVEALIRWQHPEMGLVMPAKFIPLAEECGLIEQFGHWVLRTACAQMRAWLDQGVELKRMAVNVSGLQFQRGDLVATINGVLAQTGLCPPSLELEITEGYVMEKTEQAIEVLQQIQALGVRLAIDDFGTGYSSLSYLKRLPVDKLKIDKSFVRDLPGDASDEAIARAVVALGHSLKLDVIAEGVETEVQFNFLSTLGCEHGQGYFFGDPLPADAFVESIRRHSQ